MEESEKIELSKEELDARLAVLRRFKNLLKEQRDKFSDYLLVLESQNKSIIKEDSESILHHTEIEQSIISEILNIQKVIEPIEAIHKFTQSESEINEVVKLKEDLSLIKAQVLEQNKKNRELLKSRMNFLRSSLSSMNTVPVYKNVYASSQNTASYVDISL